MLFISWDLQINICYFFNPFSTCLDFLVFFVIFNLPIVGEVPNGILH